MNVTLNNTEINQAIVDYISSIGIDTLNKNIEVHITTSRKQGGVTAAITVEPWNGDTAEVTDVTPTTAVETSVDTEEVKLFD